MKHHTCVLLSLSLVLAACGAQCQIPGFPVDGTRTVDFADFGEFEYEQTGALGYCPSLKFHTALIQRVDSGIYTVQFTAVAEGTPGVDRCDWSLIPDDELWGGETDSWDTFGLAAADSSGSTSCPVLRTSLPQALTDTEVARLLDIFRAVQIRTDSSWIGFCVDPCAVDTTRWDDYSVTSIVSCIDGPVELLEEASQRAIIDFLTDVYDRTMGSASGS